MKKDDIELPPIPDLQTFPASVFNHEVMVMDHVAVTDILKEYAISAIEVDRQRSGEPVAWRHKTPTDWHATADAARALGVAKHRSVEPLYAAPHPTEEVFCEECGDGLVVEDPGICGTCYQTKYVSPQTADPVMAWRVGRELFHTEEEARANVRNPDLNPIPLCDCERGHNGMGMTGRECECGVPHPDEPVKVLSDDEDYITEFLSEHADLNVEHGRMTFDKWTLRDAVRALLARYGRHAKSISAPTAVTACCGRAECGGECGNEWRGMVAVIPEVWQLVPKELIEFIEAKEHHLPIEDRHALSNMLKASPKFGEES